MAVKKTMPEAGGTGTPSTHGGKGSPRKSPVAERSKPTKKAAERLPVREDESPWAPEELAEVRDELEADAQRLQAEVDEAAAELSELMRDSGEGAGDDQADAGAKTYEREQEISLANNSRELLAQSLHALERIFDGTYGRCESCNNPIGKRRLQAFPRATLCMTCKQREERR